MNGKGMRPIVGYNYGKYRDNYPKSMGKKATPQPVSHHPPPAPRRQRPRPSHPTGGA